MLFLSYRSIRCELMVHSEPPNQSDPTRLRLESLGRRIMLLRVTAKPKISQEKLAERAGISRPELSRIEKGANPSMAIIYKIADGLGVHIVDLVDDRMPMPGDEYRGSQNRPAGPHT
jgi:transcriptional regulator with XRE-family HTH domain